MVRVFGFIDVQKDFMNSDGALYVPNAESIKGNIKKILKFAQEYNLPIFFTQDQHDGSEPEMANNGGPFPLHCMKGTTGAENIIDTQARYFEKQCYDVFDGKYGNKNIAKWLQDEMVTEVWMAGVATDYCVKAAALGIRKIKVGESQRQIDVYIFDNAIMGVAPETTESAIKEMKEAGCHFVKCDL